MTLPTELPHFTPPQVDQYETELYRRYLEADCPEVAQAALSDIRALGRFICCGEMPSE